MKACKISNTLNITCNASGAAEAAAKGHVVVIVDVIDMSTTAEAFLEQGALAVLGAAPVGTHVPVDVNPYNVGIRAGELAKQAGTGVIMIAEPRIGGDDERLQRAAEAIRGVGAAGAVFEGPFPNIGAETIKLCDCANKVVVVVSDTGGASYDAALQGNAKNVLTGTIARTYGKKGVEPALHAARRAILAAQEADCGITIVAASANSMEDILAAQKIYELIIQEGFLSIAKKH